MSLITVRPRKRSDQYLFWEGVFSVLSRQGMRSRATSASEQCIALAVAEKIDATSLCNALEEFGIVRVQPGKASITLVGEGLGTMKGFAARVFAVLSEMTVDMVSFGASELSLTLVLDEVLVDRALQGLHEAFFSG
jgi:aspartate kinase